MNRNRELLPSHPAYPTIRKWRDQGVWCKLDDSGSVEIENCKPDSAGNFQDVPPAAVLELAEYHDEILSDLLFWEGVIDRVTAIWLQHGNAYRIENRIRTVIKQ